MNGYPARHRPVTDHPRVSEALLPRGSAADRILRAIRPVDCGSDDRSSQHSRRRLGKRLADVADGHQAPDVAGVSVEEGGWRLRVRCSGVCGGLRAAGRPAGFSLRRGGEEQPVI